MPQPPAPTIPIGLVMIMRNENRWQTEVYQILDSARFFEKHFSEGGRNASQREARNATEQSAFTGPRAFSFAGLANYSSSSSSSFSTSLAHETTRSPSSGSTSRTPWVTPPLPRICFSPESATFPFLLQ